MMPKYYALFPVAALLAGCGNKEAVKAAPAKPPSVAVARVERGTVGTELELAADFRPYQEADLYAKVAGYMRTIQVDIGSVVKQGQVLATLEVPELDRDFEHATATEKRVGLDVGRARGDLQRAESILQIYQLSFQRLDSIAKSRPKLVAQQEIDSAASKYQEAQAQVAAARANLASMEQQVQVAQSVRSRVDVMRNYLTITAPFSGVITKRYADPGAMIQAGTASQSGARPVVRLSQIDRLRLVVPIPESAVPSIRINQAVEVRVGTLGRVFQGRVSRFSDSIDPATRTMDTQIDLANPGFVLKPGMFAQVVIPMERHERALTIPPQALLDRHGPVVLAVNNSHVVEERRIRKGLETTDSVEVLAGLLPGEMVVTAGAAQLKAGQTVTPKILEAAR